MNTRNITTITELEIEYCTGTVFRHIHDTVEEAIGEFTKALIEALEPPYPSLPHIKSMTINTIKSIYIGEGDDEYEHEYTLKVRAPEISVFPCAHDPQVA